MDRDDWSELLTAVKWLHTIVEENFDLTLYDVPDNVYDIKHCISRLESMLEIDFDDLKGVL